MNGIIKEELGVLLQYGIVIDGDPCRDWTVVLKPLLDFDPTGEVEVEVEVEV